MGFLLVCHFSVVCPSNKLILRILDLSAIFPVQQAMLYYHSKSTPIPVLISKFLTSRIRSDGLPITKSVANPFLLAFVQVMFDNCYSSLFFIENGAVIVLGNDCH